MTAPTLALTLLAASAAALAGGCDKKQPAPPAPVPSAAAAVDLAAAKPADPTVAMDALCRLCRLADVYHAGAFAALTLTFADGKATDDKGRAYQVSAEEWKGVVALAEGSPGQRAAGRALPAKARNYADGLGKARRHAYEISPVEAPKKLLFTIVKPLGDESEG